MQPWPPSPLPEQPPVALPVCFSQTRVTRDTNPFPQGAMGPFLAFHSLASLRGPGKPLPAEVGAQCGRRSSREGDVFLAPAELTFQREDRSGHRPVPRSCL